jgi:hypothetical protein
MECDFIDMEVSAFSGFMELTFGLKRIIPGKPKEKCVEYAENSIKT